MLIKIKVKSNTIFDTHYFNLDKGIPILKSSHISIK